ncbi:MAG: hypothetical protein RL676_1318 [Pseudomonadota bacterium]
MDAPVKRLILLFRDPWARLGVRDMLPGLVAMSTWGLVTGVAMVKSGLSAWQALGMTLVVYAGSAQLASLPLLAAGAPLAIIWASALIVNLRFVMYSVVIAPVFRHFSWLKRAVHGFGNVDILSAELLRRFDASSLAARPSPALLREDPGQNASPSLPAPVAYFRGAAVVNWTVWQSASIAGIFLAQWVPTAWGLEFVATLALLAMLLPMIGDRAGLVCAVTAGVVALLAVSLPLNLGLLLGVLAGVLVALWMDKRKDASSHGT